MFFLITLVFVFLILSLWTYIQGKKTEKFSTTLKKFRSDFSELADKDALINEIIARKKRFLAYGTYIPVPAGEYIATFEMTSVSSELAHCQLQVSSDKGKSIIASQDFLLENFPVTKELPFQVSAENEIEPRILYSFGRRFMKSTNGLSQ